MKPSPSPREVAALVPDGASVMIGGFMGVGSPHRIIDALVARGARGLTVIANDTARPTVGIGKLIAARCVARVIVSHIGTNPETQRQMIAGEIEVDLVPQGTLAERIRAAGAGLGGVLTRTGVGTLVAEGKQVIALDGEDYLLERALHADVALLAARTADYSGNLAYALTARNFNPLMALAAKLVIAEPNEIVPVGVLPPDAVHTPGVVIDHLLERPRVARRARMDAKELIARRVAMELVDNTLVNLGIGLPTLVANYVPRGIHVFFQSENGIIGFGAPPPEGMEDIHLTDAGGAFVSALPGAVAFDSAMSFALIRGGHLAMTVLGGLQVDRHGRLANWMVPGRLVPGMGGAMDLVSGARRVVVAMSHTQKDTPKIVAELDAAADLRPPGVADRHRACGDRADRTGWCCVMAPGVKPRPMLEATSAKLIVGENTPEMAFA